MYRNVSTISRKFYIRYKLLEIESIFHFVFHSSTVEKLVGIDEICDGLAIGKSHRHRCANECLLGNQVRLHSGNQLKLQY